MTINAIKRRSDPVAPKINPGTNWTDIEINGVKPKDMSFGWVLAETRIWIWSHWWRTERRSASEPNEVHRMSKPIAAKYRGRWAEWWQCCKSRLHAQRMNGSRKKIDTLLNIDAIKVHLVTNQANHENHQNHPKIGFKLLNIIVVMLNYPKIQQKSLFSFDSSTLVITLRFLGICDDHGCSKSQADVMALVVFNNIISILIIWIMLIVERLSLSSG